MSSIIIRSMTYCVWVFHFVHLGTCGETYPQDPKIHQGPSSPPSNRRKNGLVIHIASPHLSLKKYFCNGLGFGFFKLALH
jgi:hypothetical protein